MADTPTLELRIQDNSEKAIQGLQSLASSLSDLKRTLTGGLGIDKTLEDLEKLNQKFTATFDTQTVDNINKVADALERLQKASDVKLPDMKANKSSGAGLFMSAIDTPIEYAKPDISAFDSANEDIERKLQDLKDRIEIDNSYPSIEELTNKLDALNSEIGVLGSETGSANEEVGHLDKTLKDLKENADGASNGFGNLGKGINRVISPLDKLIKAFNRILFYRVIRSVIKEISKGFSEGIANVREYSKAINGSFNTAMTNAENALFKMKNSVGAALAPAIEGLIPYIQSAVSWFINLLNVANQFFALMNGQSEWTRAIDASATSFEKQKKSASGAAKEVKNLLADFDELNIIQSQSGGGGGGAGGAVTPDYTKAFEQVTEFDGKIREIVNWTKENLDLIKDTAIAIGAAILGWRVSKAFDGILGQLGGIIAFGGAILLEWHLTSEFSDNYLQTGDLGWLVADVLTSVVGAFLGKKLAEQVFGAGTGNVGVSIMLAVSALADIVASIRNADVSALSKENIINMLLASAKFGAAGMFLAKFFKFSTNDAVLIGGGAALVTFGAAVGIKALAEAINSDDFSDEEFIKAKALSSVSMGAGATLLGTKLFNLSAGQAIGAGAGVALLTFGAYTGIKAIADAVKSEDFTEINLAKLAESSAELGIGSGVVYKALGGSVKGMFELAGGISLVTFGIASGVQAVLRAERVGYDKSYLADLAKSSLGVGLGSALTALALGASGAVAGIIGGGAALVTVGVVVAVAAILRAKKEEIQWGDISLTEAQIQDYVTQNMFTVNVPAQVNLINSKIANATRAQEDLVTNATEVFSTMNILRLGINQGETLGTLLTQVLGESKDGNGGLMKSLREDIEKKKGLLTFSLSIMPVIDQNGNDISKELATNNITGWGKVEEYVTNLGNKLNDLLIDPKTQKLKENLSEYEKNAVSEIIGTMLRISQAVSGANVETTALSNFSVSLSDMTEDSAREALKKYGEYRKELEEAYTRLQYETAAGYLSRARAAEAIGDTAEAEKAMKDYQRFIKSIPDNVKTEVDKASAQGRTMINQMFQKMFGGAFDDFENYSHVPDILELTFQNSEEKKSGQSFADYIAKWMILDLKDSVEHITGTTAEEFDKMGLYILSYIPNSIKQTYLAEVANKFGLDIADAVAKAIGVNVPEEVRKSLEEAQKKAEEKALLDMNNAKQEKTWLNDKQLAAKAAAARAEIEEAKRDLLERGANAQEDSWREDKQLSAQVALARDNVRIKYEQLVAEIADKKKYLESVNKQIEDAEERLHTKDPLGMDALRKRGAMDELYGYEKQGGGRTGGLFGKQAAIEETLRQYDEMLAELRKKAEELGVDLGDLLFPDVELGDEDEGITDIEFVIDDTALETPVTAPDLSGVTTAFDDAELQVHSDVLSIINDAMRLARIQYKYDPIVGGGGGIKMLMKAGGGFVSTGDMFVAREAGPELVGRIGSRTAVANNDQIVQGVAGGVAAGQSEQNSLLRRQNDLLMQILQKSGKAEAVPSAGWGRFIKRSIEMYANNTGT